MIRGLRFTVVALGLLALCESAWAHTRSTSYSRWTIEADGAVVTLELSLLDGDALARDLAASSRAAARPGVDHAIWRDALTRGLRLENDGAACPPDLQTFTRLATRGASLAYEWRVRCTASVGDLRVTSDLLFDLLPDHVHFAHLARGDAASDAVLTHDRRTIGLDAGASSSAMDTLARFSRLGAEHILSGWDHLLFVMALLLAARSFGQVATVVTGFTLGHSVTLCLAATGHASADPASVEAIIGLSIALLAVDGAWITCARDSLMIPALTVAALLACAVLSLFAGPVSSLALFGLALFAACYLPALHRACDAMRLRGALAALFGLIHGFGFASALAPLQATGETPLVPLLGFNLGVELGQFAVVALAWPVLVLARRSRYLGHARVMRYGATAILALGVALFASRAF